ncbi:MAG TPA: DUF2442 domain-containing protein [Rubrivivax sp.]|nr:DUF2442 domain-containing protein [Rubrivivax sp.]
MADAHPLLDDAQIAAARTAGVRTLTAARAVAARYLEIKDRIEIDLASGWSVQVPRSFSPRLAAAPTGDCEHIEIVDFGLGLHWPAVDEDWYVPAVIETLAMARAA